MNKMLDRIRLARVAGNVQRYHTQTLVKQESVAQHTFNMLNIVIILTQGQVSKRLLEAVLVHDMGEYITGDVPSPGKRALNDDAKTSFLALEESSMRAVHPTIEIELTLYEASVLKYADMLDGLMKCLDERMLGNRHIRKCAENYIAYLTENSIGPTADALALAAIQEYRNND